MRIALDAMGGDRAPEETVAGALNAAHAGIDVILVGDESRIRPLLDGTPVPIVHASEVIGMHEDPATAIRDKKDASVTVAARLVADGDAAGMVSAGSTGAALAAAAFVVGRLSGVSRPAIGTIFPFGSGIVVMDVGANLECRPEHLAQFAVMGKAIAEVYLDLKDPRVGLLNIGEEPGKGRTLERDAYALLDTSTLNFVGNVEGRDLASGRADVFVTDGFTGNVLLKTTEGAAGFLADVIGETLLGGATPDEAGRSRLVDRLAGLRARLDPESYGGAHLVGVKGVVVIAHGSSSRIAIGNALRMASEGAERGLVDRISDGLGG